MGEQESTAAETKIKAVVFMLMAQRGKSENSMERVLFQLIAVVSLPENEKWGLIESGLILLGWPGSFGSTAFCLSKMV